jgi:Na+/H+-translocating membrane pyrophosphatase
LSVVVLQPFGVAILGLLYAIFLRSQIWEDKGTEKMQEVWNAIKDVNDAYLSSSYLHFAPDCHSYHWLFFSVYISAFTRGY